MLNMIRSALLVIGIYALAYAARPGDQTWQALLGGVLIGAYVSLGDLK